MAHLTWQPTQVTRFISRVSGSSTRPLRVRTDAGDAFIKCLGNPEGPHVLACEWIGARIADAMGLATLDFAILTVTDEDLSMGRGTEKAGPTFATRLEQGNVWNGDRAMLTRLNNPADLAKLVVLDTLLLNWDRYAPAGRRINRENVFLSRERGGAGSTTVLAMDHTHVMLTSGRLAEQLCHIDRIKNEEVYGLFPAFAPYLTEFAVNQAVQSLGELTDDLIDGVLGEFPVEWEVQRLEQAAVRTFLMNRRSYLQETLFDRLSVEIGVQRAMMDQEED